MSSISLASVLEVDVGSSIGQCRAMPVSLGSGKPEGILAVYGADFDVDPYVEMFFFPTDTLKMVLFDQEGKILWRRDLGRGVVPGIWFCPVYTFDLDGDGVDEIWYVNNVNADHQVSVRGLRLERIDAASGATTGQWPWCYRNAYEQLGGHRHFIGGAYVNNSPVLFTATGTYHDMHLFGWNPDMSMRWEYTVGRDDPGARGSHMLTFVDINHDGIDEVMWGERCVSMDTGEELFCCDRDSYRGHSDIIQPFVDYDSGAWHIFTCREQDPQASPRIACYDSSGSRIWGHVDRGHIDMGWVARIGDSFGMIASGIRIGKKTCGPDGRHHESMDEFTYDALTGEPVDLGFETYRTIPVDIDGDGYHELVRGRASGNGEVIDRHGSHIADLGAAVAMNHKFMDLPGEQLLAYYPDGKLRVWADTNARDSEEALARYNHPYYRTNRHNSGVGYNLMCLGGL